MSTPKSNKNKPAMLLTSEGLPLDHTQSATRTTDTDGGPARRISCVPPSLASAVPSPTFLRPTNNLKRSAAASTTTRSSSLRELSLRRSLIDDDDEEIIDYFSPRSFSAPDASESGNLSDLSSSDTSNKGTSNSSWCVRTAPTLPSFYPLEKSAVFIPQASPSVLSSRISSVLKDRSIIATYDNKNAKVDCISTTNVEFRIRLYRGRGEYKHGIIVEVQRRLGFNLSYMHDVYAILDAAEGKLQDYGEGNKSGAFQYPSNYSDVGGDSDSDEDSDALENTGGLTSLRVISDILVCPPPQEDGGDDQEVKVEARDFALSSLASLTSTASMGHSASKFSNELLADEAYGDLREAVFSNVGPSRATSSHAQDPQDSLAHNTPQRSSLKCLEVLSNVTSSLKKDSSLLVNLLSQNDDEILLKLIVNIENAKINPRSADLSCVVLKNVKGVVLSPYNKGMLTTALTEARLYGEECYLDLEIHAQQCLDLLEL